MNKNLCPHLVCTFNFNTWKQGSEGKVEGQCGILEETNDGDCGGIERGKTGAKEVAQWLTVHTSLHRPCVWVSGPM